VKLVIEDAEHFTTQMYTKFMCLLIAAYYSFGVQGRPQALAKLTFKEYIVAREAGCDPASNMLKTSVSYGYQASLNPRRCIHCIIFAVSFLQIIAITGIAKTLTTYYLTLRDIVVDLRKDAGRSTKKSTHDWFLLSVTGSKPVRVGKRLTEFFEAALGIHIDTRTIRMLIETEMEDAYESGRISRGERLAVMRSNGHCEATVSKFYTPRRR
jgi:hypothetical protein